MSSPMSLSDSKHTYVSDLSTIEDAVSYDNRTKPVVNGICFSDWLRTLSPVTIHEYALTATMKAFFDITSDNVPFSFFRTPFGRVKMLCSAYEDGLDDHTVALLLFVERHIPPHPTPFSMVQTGKYSIRVYENAKKYLEMLAQTAERHRHALAKVGLVEIFSTNIYNISTDRQSGLRALLSVVRNLEDHDVWDFFVDGDTGSLNLRDADLLQYILDNPSLAQLISYSMVARRTDDLRTISMMAESESLSISSGIL